MLFGAGVKKNSVVSALLCTFCLYNIHMLLVYGGYIIALCDHLTAHEKGKGKAVFRRRPGCHIYVLVIIITMIAVISST